MSSLSEFLHAQRNWTFRRQTKPPILSVGSVLKKQTFVASVVVCIQFVAGVLFTVRPNEIKQLIGIIALFLNITLLISFYPSRKRNPRGWVPSGICVLGLVSTFTIGTSLGFALRMRSFERNYPTYLEVIQKVEKGEIATGLSFVRIDLPKDFSQTTFAKTNLQGGATVEFLIGGGFPVKHSGFLYVSTGDIKDDSELSRSWPRHSKIRDRWYVIGD